MPTVISMTSDKILTVDLPLSRGFIDHFSVDFAFFAE
jgi:hypothetical protein